MNFNESPNTWSKCDGTKKSPNAGLNEKKNNQLLYPFLQDNFMTEQSILHQVF